MDKQALSAKLENIWYYYKVHIIAAIVILLVVIPTISSSLHNKKSALNVALIGITTQEDKQPAFQNAATSAVLKDPHSNAIVSVQFWPVAGSINDPANNAIQQKLTVMTAAKDLDVVVMNQDDFLFYAKQGFFMNLESVPQLAGIIQKAGKGVVKAVHSTDTQEHIYGIDVGSDLLLKNAGFDTRNKAIGIMVNTDRLNTSIQFVDWLFGTEQR